jgi:hypothetical protein
MEAEKTTPPEGGRRGEARQELPGRFIILHSPYRSHPRRTHARYLRTRVPELRPQPGRPDQEQHRVYRGNLLDDFRVSEKRFCAERHANRQSLGASTKSCLTGL